jgi:hypothetical protein
MDLLQYSRIRICVNLSRITDTSGTGYCRIRKGIDVCRTWSLGEGVQSIVFSLGAPDGLKNERPFHTGNV